jgi:hypothetical protein
MGFAMLCGVISAMAEFMVRVLHPSSANRIHDVSGVKPCHTCDAISVVVAEFMVDVTGVKPCHTFEPRACTPGMHRLITIHLLTSCPVLPLSISQH